MAVNYFGSVADVLDAWAGGQAIQVLHDDTHAM